MANREILDANPRGDLVVNDAVGNRGRDREQDDLEGFHGDTLQHAAQPQRGRSIDRGPVQPGNYSRYNLRL